MQKVSRCEKCDGDVIHLNFMHSLVCVWCGLHYDIDGKPNVELTQNNLPKAETKTGKK